MGTSDGSQWFGECYAPCFLKTSFVYFKKEQAHHSSYTRQNLSPVLNKLCFSSGSPKHFHHSPPFIDGFYIVDIVLVLNMHVIFIVGRDLDIKRAQEPFNLFNPVIFLWLSKTRTYFLVIYIRRSKRFARGVCCAWLYCCSLLNYFFSQNVIFQKTIDRWFVSNILLMYISHRPSILIICNH